MKRRDFLSLLGGAVAAWPSPARAQPRAMPTVGVLLVFSREAGQTFTDPIRAYLQALGHAEGRNIVFDFRYADGKPDRLPGLAADLAGQRPAVIATFGDAAGLAAKGGDHHHSHRGHVRRPGQSRARRQHATAGG